MKNFGSILALLALSATVISGRALPDAESGLEVRAPMDTGESPIVDGRITLITLSLRDHCSFTQERKGCR